MYKCKICSKEFELNKEFHYISRDEEITGLVNVVKKEGVKIFDTFDCPHCGCQNVMQGRKRVDKSNAIVVGKKAEDKSEEKEDCDVVGLPTEEDFKAVENMAHEKLEEKEQGCFGYYQEYIDKCRKCKDKEKCMDEIEKSRPVCFGDINSISGECSSETCELYKQCSEKVCEQNNECAEEEQEEDER